MPANTPAALVEHGTTETQAVHVGTLDSLPALVARSGVKAPTLLIVGHVVRLRGKLEWFNPGAARQAIGESVPRDTGP